MREVEKQTRGAARANRSSTDVMKVAWGNVEEQIGKGLAPTVDKAAEKLTDLATALEPVFGRKDLDLGEKLTLSGRHTRRIFGPMVDEAEREFGRLDLGEKLAMGVERGMPLVANAAAQAAPRTAEAFLTGFMNAGPWGRLITAGVLYSKLRGPISGAGGLAAGGFAGGMAGGMGPAIDGKKAKGKFGKAGSKLGGMMGGPAGAAFLLTFGPELDNALAAAGDRLLGEGNRFSREARRQGWNSLGGLLTPESAGVTTGSPESRSKRDQLLGNGQLPQIREHLSTHPRDRRFLQPRLDALEGRARRRSHPNDRPAPPPVGRGAAIDRIRGEGPTTLHSTIVLPNGEVLAQVMSKATGDKKARK